jgi:hypothetical protein
VVLIDPAPAINGEPNLLAAGGSTVQSAARTLTANSVVVRTRTIGRRKRIASS